MTDASKHMKYYVRDWGRPCGVEPKIFTNKSVAEVDSEEAQFFPEVIEFSTEIEARRFIKSSSSDKTIKVVS